MVRYCPQCGTKLKKEYKFCPECGFELVKIEAIKNSSNSTSIQDSLKKVSEVIICDNCGEDNNPSAELCSSCGVKLKGQRSTKEIMASGEEVKPSPKTKYVPETPKKVAPKKSAINKSEPDNSAQKKLNKIKLITISAIGLGIAFVILIFSGILNSVIIPGASNTVVQQNQSSGVDLNSLQKITTLEEQIKANPKDTIAILELAHLRNDAGMYQQAINNYKQYLALVPGDPDARIDMGVCYYNLQDYDTAIKEMETAIKYDPKHQIGYLNLGIVNLTAGNLEKSKEWLKKAVQLDPNSEYGKKAEELLKSHTSTNQMNGGK